LIPILSIITFLPLLGGCLALAFRRRPETCRWLSLGVAGADLLLVVALFLAPPVFEAGTWLLFEDYAWIERLGIRFSLGLDGISLVLVGLTALLGVLCILVSWREITRHVGVFHFLLLTMQTGVIGVFLATDLVLFYLFWEVQLIPMFFMIGIWGHEKRVVATVKFVLFSIVGSLLMLVAIIGIYLFHGVGTGVYSFSLFELIHTPLSTSAGMWLYAAFLLAFAIKIPVFPVHTWLPDAHTEAPTAGSVILAGLLLKTGAYGVIRFAFPLFPAAARDSLPLLIVLGLFGLFYAAWIALAQTDLKRLVAYSSISHMGLTVIGMAFWNAITLSGAVLLMINHGLTTSALFIMVGMLAERTGSRDFSRYGGLWTRMPVFSGFFLMFALASLGLPGLNNFVSEMLILLGTFRENPVVASIAFAGMVTVLIYTLRMVQETLWGESSREDALPDLSGRELTVLLPLAAAVLLLGLFPGPVLTVLQPPLQEFVQTMQRIQMAGIN
jgi:NADH-quinone oxidoreductase subunit M